MKGVRAHMTKRFLSGGGSVRKITATLSLSLTCILIAGCGLVWQSIQGAALDRDLTQVLEANGLEQREIQCRMVASSRTGFCVMDAAEEDAAQLISRLSLVLREAGDVHGNVPSWELEQGCGAVEGFTAEASARVYESARRPEILRLANGTAFEYLLVSFRQDLGTMCIQVSYAYG
jgi:hypothetical protein